MTRRSFYDVVIVGAGPNGLAAAIAMQQQGLCVLLIEAKDSVGGGMRSAQLTLPGFVHDVCSAIHPLAISSPFLSSLPLRDHGLNYIVPEIAAAHPFEGGHAAVLTRSLSTTAKLLGPDEHAYLSLLEPLVNNWPTLSRDILGPLKFPKAPFAMAAFGTKALQSSLHLAKRFKTMEARGLWGGMAAHGIQPLSNLSTAAIGLVLMIAAHDKGWPIPAGGSGAIASSMQSYFLSLGGSVETGWEVTSFEELPQASAYLFDVTPKQLLRIAGNRFSELYKWQLRRYRYGAGVFKIDWALENPIPFIAEVARKAGTIHIGNSLEEITYSEQQCWKGEHPERPFVLLAQQSLFDRTRAPENKQTAWAYCHVPNGSVKDMTEAIEKQVERFAPGFRELILGRHVMNAAAVEAYNPNYIGGDINGGVLDITQLFTRPALRISPYRTSRPGIYICSSSTPPGGGVHGMCGYHAARRALKDVFGIRMDPRS